MVRKQEVICSVQILLVTFSLLVVLEAVEE